MSGAGMVDMTELLGATFELGVKGSCFNADKQTAALFFPEDRYRAAEAKAICSTCPVNWECLNFALDTGQRDGIWGGTTYRERLGRYRDENLKYASR